MITVVLPNSPFTPHTQIRKAKQEALEKLPPGPEELLLKGDAVRVSTCYYPIRSPHLFTAYASNPFPFARLCTRLPPSSRRPWRSLRTDSPPRASGTRSL